MKNFRHSPHQVNAGSMADIAFLLLIFFLVATTISADKGIKRQLSQICPPNTNCVDKTTERNILRISINGNDDLLVDDDIVSIKDLKDIAKSFLNNNGDKTCEYCNGLNDPKSSDNPKKAIISLQNDQQTSYEMYIAVQDVLTKAYYELREDYSKNILRKSNKELTDKDLKEIRKAYPFNLLETETKK